MIITVIIPCYNAQNHIKNCLKKLIKEVLLLPGKIEVIIINDGSTDLTRQELSHFDKTFDFIKVVNQNNLGVSSARNVGLSLSKSKYVLFLDSDDSYADGVFQYLINKIDNYDFDVLEFDFSFKKNKDSQHVKENFNLVCGLDYFLGFTSVNSASNKIYKRVFLTENNINFNTDIKIGEDLLFNIIVFSLARRVVSSSKKLLKINDTNQNSVTRIKSCEKEYIIVQNFMKIFKYVFSNYKLSSTFKQRKYYLTHIIKIGVVLFYRFFKNFCKCKQVRNILLDTTI